jgi:type I restriction enzyme, S subunit
MRATSRERRFKPYPAYKDSGVEWLGEIPAGWEVAPLFTLVRERELRNVGARETNVLSLSYGQIIRRDVSDNFGLMPESFDTYQIVEPGNIVLRLTDLQNDKRSLRVGFVNERGIITSAYVALGIHEKLVPEYAASLFHAYDVTKVFYTLGGGVRQTMKFVDLKWMPLLVPSVQEQRAIAAFLHRDTERIDALVAKKERLIELLQEQRTALITRAVTKGLDPNAPMKDSGVEWLGEIPTHWEVRPFTKYVVEKSDYRGKTPEKVASGVFLVTARNVRMGLVDYDCSQEFIAEEDYDEVMRRGVPRKGDLLFTTEAPLGNVALVDREGIALAQRIIRFRMNPDHFDSRFTLFAMMSDYFQGQLLTLSTGSTAEGLKASKLPMLRLVAPPVTEQYAIAAFLDRETARIDALVAKVLEAIERLKELRTALISAAVTGKIDVREEVAA